MASLNLVEKITALLDEDGNARPNLNEPLPLQGMPQFGSFIQRQLEELAITKPRLDSHSAFMDLLAIALEATSCERRHCATSDQSAQSSRGESSGVVFDEVCGQIYKAIYVYRSMSPTTFLLSLLLLPHNSIPTNLIQRHNIGPQSKLVNPLSDQCLQTRDSPPPTILRQLH